MKKLKIFASGITALFLILFSATPVFAGGGGVYADTTYTDDPHWNIVRVYFDPKLFPCKGLVVTLNYANPENGDKISGGNGDNSSTINSDASNETVSGKQYLRCSTYAKVYSPVLKYNRILNISYKGPNLEGGRTIAVSFGYGLNYGSFPLLPWEGPSDFIPVPTPTQQPTPAVPPVPELPDSPAPVIITPTPNDSKVDELNKKINELQTQVVESQKAQSDLEKRINELVSFIKKLFPFFN